AVQAYHRALEISPDDASTHNNLGDALKQQGRLEQAIQAYHRATEINPNYMKAHNNLGNTFSQQGRLEEAVQAYHRALEINPNDASTHNNLGNALQEQGKLELAIQAYRRSTEIDPNYLQAYNNLGNAFRQQDRSEEAIQAYHQAIGIDAGYAEAHYSLGNLLRELGRLEPAVQAYRKALSINPNDVATHYMLAKTKKHGSYDHEICAMEALLENPSITNPQKVDLYFALGKAFEDLKMYEKAFELFSIGNKDKRETVEYDISQDEDFFKRLMGTFSKPLLDRYSGCGFDDDTPIFILGMPRSGTSLVEQILSSHSKVYGAGELYDLRQTILTSNPKVAHHRFPDHLDQLNRNEFAQFGINYVKRLREYSHDARHITDKIPANFLYIGMIKLILPNAKVIHCQRNPIDTCLSCFKNCFALGHRFSYDLQELGRYYQLYKQLMSHWNEVLPDYIFHFQYEDLIVNQEKQTRLLLEHCGLEWEESCLSFHQTERLVKTMSSPQVRRSLYSDSVGLWKKYETQLQPLISMLTATE
ncbi:TPA: sulfotransferase family protein, partial [Candidatus Poribacteria bacterium]|nr:sulfotransferase family protein [Candidatus Poribacteria bacterium]